MGSKSGIAAALAAATEVKPALCKKLLETLAEVATKEVKSAGKFTIPGLCMLKTQEASNQGRQEGGVRQGDDGQGQASHHGGQGILCVSAQEEHLRSVSVQWVHARVDIPLVLHCRQAGRRFACISRVVDHE